MVVPRLSNYLILSISIGTSNGLSSGMAAWIGNILYRTLRLKHPRISFAEHCSNNISQSSHLVMKAGGVEWLQVIHLTLTKEIDMM
mmetsp:Transcript_36085/g.61528  ORF Transcript_36085/g.61528 Transcript_36085/m.61528 type:complete len:86 (-) Transcript_36085:313-570(-)